MVRDFLGCLTARQKEIIQLSYFEEMNQEKIADYLGIRQQSVCEMMQDDLLETIASAISKLQMIEDKYYYSLDLNSYLNNLEDDAYEE